jgi:hypothetical protein
MSTYSTPRIHRGPKPEKKLTDSTYRKNSLNELIRDFGGRCAYSMYYAIQDGESQVEVDHFNPNPKSSRSKHKHNNDYSNLFLASAHCNNTKRDTWPTKAQRANGFRFINPCEEMDYGIHIFENPVTHKLEGATPAGWYQIRHLGLNAEHLIQKRIDRSKIKQALTGWFVSQDCSVDFDKLEEAKRIIDLLREQLNRGIPDIPPPPVA